MATPEWKQQNPKLSAHIPQSLHDKLEQFARDRGLKSTSKALRIILEEYFESTGVPNYYPGSSQLVQNQIEERFRAIESQIKEINARLGRFKTIPQDSEVLNSERQSSLLVQNPESKSPQSVPNSSQLSVFGGWLTTGEAHSEAQRRGYEKALGTFRRNLRGGVVPNELARIGLVADFGVRDQANPKDNSVRWLRFE